MLNPLQFVADYAKWQQTANMMEIRIGELYTAVGAERSAVPPVDTIGLAVSLERFRLTLGISFHLSVRCDGNPMIYTRTMHAFRRNWPKLRRGTPKSEAIRLPEPDETEEARESLAEQQV